jgi:3-keto-disaccharide hydrolase
MNMSSALLRVCCFTCILLTGQLLAQSTPNQLSPAEKAAGWNLLFDGQTTHGWHSFKKNSFPSSGWGIEDGWLHCLGKNGGDVLSDGEYEQFELQWEWKIEPAGNSGLKYFVVESRSSALGHEYQMLDDQRNPDGKIAGGKHVTASFYDVLKPTVPPPTKPVGEINQSRILVKGNHVEHWLNGVKVLEYECGSDAVKTAVAESKFKNVPGFGDRVKAHLLLQDHHSQAWFRNIKIRNLSSDN